jgi:uncharacterized metal-binding protein YceD (DUF177 family)
MSKAVGGRLSERAWSVPVSLHDVPETGRRFELSADAETRAAVAKVAGLRDLSRLETFFDVTRYRDGLRVAGQVSATVGQVCVVTLEPIENEFEEAVDLIFDPGVATAPADVPEEESKTARAKAAVQVALDDDGPEPLVGDTVDLGALAVEFLILGLDPYPRKPGAVFDAPPAEVKGEHPFAALAKLRGGQGGNDG